MPTTLPERLIVDCISTPIGTALAVTDEADRLRALDWQEHEPRMRRLLHIHYGGAADLVCAGLAPAAVRDGIAAYFEGDLTAPELIICMTAGTPFQRAVWRALREIPAGETRSYGEIAARVGRPKAVRAVGLANGANPIGIVVPCHRVIGADGSLTGYGGGMERKRWLLDHERGRHQLPARANASSSALASTSGGCAPTSSSSSIQIVGSA